MASIWRRTASNSARQAAERCLTQVWERPLRVSPTEIPSYAETSEILRRLACQGFLSAAAQPTSPGPVAGRHGGANTELDQRATLRDGGHPALSLASNPGDGLFVSLRGRLGGKCTSVFSDRNGAVLHRVVIQHRGFAAKPKKSKARREEASETDEDVTGFAKKKAVEMMDSGLDALSVDLSKLRTGRASPGMLDHIIVVAQGVRTPLSHIAAVSLNGLQSLSVLPYDPSLVKEVEKSLLNSSLGLNPQIDGASLTVPVPRLTKEHRETMCSVVGKAGESAKLAIRRARKEALDHAKKSGSLSKDEIRVFEKEVEKLTKKHAKSVDDLCKAKEKEIMA